MVTRRHGAKCLIIVEKEDCFSGGLHLNKLSRFIFEREKFVFLLGAYVAKLARQEDGYLFLGILKFDLLQFY